MATFSVGWEASDSKGGFDGFASASPVFRVQSSRNVSRTIKSTCPMIGDIDGHKSGRTFGHRFSHSKDGRLPPRLMARKKVKLEWIANDTARKATFKKRKKGLMKKVSELSTLCDVKACMLIYGPDEPHADVWPSVPDAMRVLARLKRLPETEQSKKMMNQEALMRQRIRKLQEQLQKQDKENRELETALLMHQCLSGRSLHDVAIEDVTALAWMTEMNMKKVRQRIEDAALKSAEKVKEEKPVVNDKGKTPMSAAATEELPRQDWFAGAMDLSELMIIRNDDHKNTWLNTYYPMD
ncbi:hypothetical protein C4D60_Mb03t05200 [Musa balbisiana]|uniref:MADS-box domain-containing protein n=1 Tax=Musa balbisiana TaxID=52838 RepID=A0A4S8J7N3_MUSBA|nr:hypothetical protein C4D60_Mb03t05200 [Musa balbisiana]